MKSDRIPEHLVLIPDGNRRWAREKGLHVFEGHRRALMKENIVLLLKEAQNIGIKYLSLWGFSTENWKRSAIEKVFLFNLFTKTIEDLNDFLHENKIKVRHIGRKDRLPKKLVKALEKIAIDFLSYEKR